MNFVIQYFSPTLIEGCMSYEKTNALFLKTHAPLYLPEREFFLKFGPKSCNKTADIHVVGNKTILASPFCEPDPLDRGDVISELGPPREPYGHIVVQ